MAAIAAIPSGCGMDARHDCLVVGSAVADVLVRPVALGAAIGGGRILHVDPLEATTGGLVCNTGMALTRLGHTVVAAGVVGRDAWGDLIRTRLAIAGIDATALASSAGRATSTTVALIDASGERTFMHHVGAMAELDEGFVTGILPAAARARWTIVGYVGLLPGLEPRLGSALAAIRATGCRVGLETAGAGGTLADVAAALPHVDLYVPSLDEAVRQTGLTDPAAAVRRYRGLGARGIVGVKLGARGALLAGPEGEPIEIPCLPAPGPVVDTTGAGDAFLAGLVAGLSRGMGLREAGLLGAATAACCVTGPGATAGLRSFPETMALVPGG